MANYYPLLLDLTKIRCLVVGGGEVALRKAASLKEAGADITVISPEIISPLIKQGEKGEIKLIKRAYQKGDLKGFPLVYVAIDDQAMSAEIGAEARAEGVLVNIADHPDQGNFIVPAKMQRGDLSLFISTNGKSPLLAKKIRQELEERYGAEYQDLLQLLGRERVWALHRIPKIEQRKSYFEELVFSDFLDLLKAGKTEEVEEKINSIRIEILSKDTGGKGSGKGGK